MAGPLDYLKKGWQVANTPLVNADQTADAIDSPSVERSPGMARLQGFGAGALQGLAGLSTPLNIAGMMAGPAMGALKGVSRMGQMAQKAAPTLDLIDTPIPKQIMPSMDDANSLIGDLQRNLARVPSKRPAPMDTLGESLPEFTPMGGEGLYNAGKGVNQQLPADILDMLMSKMGGRGR